MWMLSTDRAELHYFNSPEDVPGGYAILSHVWAKPPEPPEQTFQDIQDLRRKRTVFRRNPLKRVSPKIRECCKLVSRHGFKWVWIDTCCIDKSSSAELSEAINSMYRYYSLAEVCYAYLPDVQLTSARGWKADDDAHAPSDRPWEDAEDFEVLQGKPIFEVIPEADDWDSRSNPGMSDSERFQARFRNSKWHTRGWTLQELLAPQVVIFVSREWEVLGTKAELAPLLEQVTKIPRSVLMLEENVMDVSIAKRMSWAARRETTRVEDEAYCLMGIFGVNMPTLYGEGKKAFQRLQEEILKQSPDTSLFAWGEVQNESDVDGNVVWTTRDRNDVQQTSLFASSPSAFDMCTASFVPSLVRQHIAMTAHSADYFDRPRDQCSGVRGGTLG